MAYIFEMASGTEYLGEDLRFPDESPTTRTAPSHTPCRDHQVELRLAPVAMATPQENEPDFLAALDPVELIDRMTD
jgi:hypothetical protein